jgi:hypothetical protein
MPNFGSQNKRRAGKKEQLLAFLFVLYFLKIYDFKFENPL